MTSLNEQEQEIMPGVSRTSISGVTPQVDKIKTDALEAGKGQKEDKGAEGPGDKDRTFTIKESAELSPTNKLRFAEVTTCPNCLSKLSLPTAGRRALRGSFHGRAGNGQSG